MLLMTITAALLHLVSQQYDSCILCTSCSYNIPGGRARWQPYLMQAIYLVGGAGGSCTSCRQYTWCEGQVAAVPHAGNIPGGRDRWQLYLMQVIYLVGGAGGSRTSCR